MIGTHTMKVITPTEYRNRRYAGVLQGLHESPEELSIELNRVYMQEDRLGNKGIFM